MTMAPLMKPYHDQAVNHERHRRCPPHGLLRAVGWIFQAEQLLAILESDLDRPPRRICRKDFSGIPVETGAVEHLLRAFAQRVAHQDDGQQPILACLVVQRLHGLDQERRMQSKLIEDQFLPRLLLVVGPGSHARKSLSLLAMSALLAGDRCRCWLVQRSLGMHVADEFDIGGKLPKYTRTAVCTVAGDKQFSFGKPACDEGNQL